MVVGESVARCSKALGALSEGLSSKGTSSVGSCPGCTPSAPISIASFSFSFSLPLDGPTDSPLKEAPSPSRESSTRPLKVQAPRVQVHQQVWALALAWQVFLVVSLVSMLYFFRPLVVLSVSTYCL